MSGHVFVIPGDIRRLACDAWLVPSDRDGSVVRGWFGWPDPEQDGETARSLERVELSVVRVADTGLPGPRPWRGNVVGPGGPERCAQDFVRLAGATAWSQRMGRGRACPLLAMPLLGTRYGGHARWAGDVVESLLKVLDEAARAARVDVALVVNEEAGYAAAQAVRRRDPERWFKTPVGARSGLETLVREARAGKLVLFVGAGASVGAGLPMWSALVDGLAREAGLGDELEALSKLPLLDRARIIERHFEGKNPGMRESIAKGLLVSHASLVHHLTAALPVNEVVTTNYDDLFELAAEGFSPGLSVLPHAPAPEAQRWILKMHGCVTCPSDIVLTRDDYLRYEQRRAALAGIVQALLITRHMLFVGFSLADDNFHRIADAVRRARGRDVRGQSSLFGSVLTLAHDRFAESLWEGELSFVPVGEAYPKDTEAKEREVLQSQRAREMELLLDELAARSASTVSSLLRPDFAGALTPADEALAEALGALQEGLSEEARSSEAYGEVEALFARLQAVPGLDLAARDDASRARRAGVQRGPPGV